MVLERIYQDVEEYKLETFTDILESQGEIYNYILDKIGMISLLMVEDYYFNHKHAHEQAIIIATDLIYNFQKGNRRYVGYMIEEIYGVARSRRMIERFEYMNETGKNLETPMVSHD